MKLAVALLVISGACGPGIERPTYRASYLKDATDQLVAASQANDVAGVRRFLRGDVVNGGIWFDDTSCMRSFAFPGEVPRDKLDELARCLAGLHLTRSVRASALPDVAVLTTASGIELEARLFKRDGVALTWIGYVARRDLQDGLPTIAPGIFLSHRKVGTDARAVSDDEYAWLKVCVDATGAVTGVHAREASTPAAARAFSEVARNWQFEPFVLHGQPQPVCGVIAQGNPIHTPDGRLAARPLPLPLPSEPTELTIVPPRSLGPRTGVWQVIPDQETERALRREHVDELLGAFEYCVDVTGHVDRVLMVRSSGVANYDQRLIRAIRGWTYAPFLDDGKPAAVCSAVHFVFHLDIR